MARSHSWPQAVLPVILLGLEVSRASACGLEQQIFSRGSGNQIPLQRASAEPAFYCASRQFHVLGFRNLDAALQVVRAVNVVAFWPAMGRTGAGLTPAAAAVTAWAGLRGLVGLILALLVLLDPRIGGTVDGAAYRQRAFFFMATTVVLTVVVQGTAFELLLNLRVCSRIHMYYE